MPIFFLFFFFFNDTATTEIYTLSLHDALPIYAGNAIQTVESTDPKVVATVRTASFGATGTGSAAPIEEIPAAGDPAVSSFIGEALAKSDRPELTSAKIIISGGRAMQKA